MTLPPQSPEISSTNFWPKPVEPRGFGATTTQPCAAQSVGFQRADQPSSHAPCGPPWMRKTTGILLRGVERRGLHEPVLDARAARRPSSTGSRATDIATSFRHERFSSVRALGAEEEEEEEDFSSSGKEKTSGGAVREASVKIRVFAPALTLPMFPPFLRRRGLPPARDTSKRSPLPSLSAVK